MNKEIYLKDIGESLALLSRQVEIFNCVNFYDINIIAEDFYAELLNMIFGYELKNLNVAEKNAPAIDLSDEKSKISIQVTSDNTSEKVKETIRKYIEQKHYLKYDKLIVLMLVKKKNYTTVFDTQNNFKFDSKTDIIDYTDLIKSIRGKKTKELKDISEFLSDEFINKLQEEKKTQASEIDTIIDLIEYITKNRTLKNNRDFVVDPEYKIYNRFREFSERIVTEYTTLFTIYGEAVTSIHTMLNIDEAQELITIMFLQDISIQYLDVTNDDPIEALKRLVNYFEEKLSINGKKYDRAAIKFYLVNELIKCNIFPNERSEYNDRNQSQC